MNEDNARSVHSCETGGKRLIWFTREKHSEQATNFEPSKYVHFGYFFSVSLHEMSSYMYIVIDSNLWSICLVWLYGYLFNLEIKIAYKNDILEQICISIR